MSKIFLKRGDIYNQTEDNFSISSRLDKGIFQIKQDQQTGVLFLERIANEFHFGFKLYGVDETLVKHVIDTYEKQPIKKNIGVLLNGAKGTGKTVTAKIMANKLGLPVIICDKSYGGLATFLASINHDCIFFFDEFEKNFRLKYDDDDDDEDAAGEDLLSIMDGVYNSDNCHIFLLTTNKLKVNDNLLSRPSRIRYLKSFSDVIDEKVLNEFIDDNLKYPEYKQEIIEFVVEDETFTYKNISLKGIKFNIYADEDIKTPDGNHLYYNKGDLVQTVTTDENGYVKSKKLPLGKYYLVEVETKENYVLDTKEYHFELTEKDNKTAIVYDTYKAYNYLKKGTLEFTKTDLITGDVIPNTLIGLLSLS